MCGRFALEFVPGPLLEAFGLTAPLLTPRYNIAPTQTAPALLLDPDSGKPALQPLLWGLVPFWAKDASCAARCINARLETAAEKPAFRAAFRHRRCLIPASGFYEWRRDGKVKQPFFFSAANASDGLALAGLWEEWSRGDAHIRSFTILTTAADGLVKSYHDRMPVILSAAVWRDWLDPSRQHPKDVVAVLPKLSENGLQCRLVSNFVNKVENEGEECVRSVTI